MPEANLSRKRNFKHFLKQPASQDCRNMQTDYEHAMFIVCKQKTVITGVTRNNIFRICASVICFTSRLFQHGVKKGVTMAGRKTFRSSQKTSFCSLRVQIVRKNGFFLCFHYVSFLAWSAAGELLHVFLNNSGEKNIYEMQSTQTESSRDCVP